MKSKFIPAVALIIALMSCHTSPNGTYAVYKSERHSGSEQHFEALKRKYAYNKYNLKFADKYIQLTEVESKQTIMLADGGIELPNQHVYKETTIEGADSISVTVSIMLSEKDTVLNIYAEGPGKALEHTIIPNQTSLNCFLSKVSD